MNAESPFVEDYATARRRFREGAARLGWGLEALPIAGRGPAGEDLTIDVATSPSPAEKALVLSSGVHGVEGFFGSAVQVELLEQWASGARPAPPVRCVFLHGLNPFGFAHLRRFDADNVDQNRNFLLPGEPYAGSPPGYADLDGLMNPQRPPSRWEPFTLKALWAIARHGMPAIRQAVAGGQYDFPRGIFYGGSGPSPTTRLMSEHLGRWLGGARDVVHLDFHTGLGEWGTYRLLIDYELTPAQQTRLASWLGVGSFEACDPRGISYDAR